MISISKKYKNNKNLSSNQLESEAVAVQEPTAESIIYLLLFWRTFHETNYENDTFPEFLQHIGAIKLYMAQYTPNLS